MKAFFSHPWVFIPSRIPIGLARLLPRCRLSWSDIGDSNIMGIFWKFYYWTQPNPTHGWTRPVGHEHLWCRWPQVGNQIRGGCI